MPVGEGMKNVTIAQPYMYLSLGGNIYEVSAMEPFQLVRETTMANYGSGDTTTGAGNWKYATVPSRPGTAPTSSSQTTLVTLYSYNALTGDQQVITDPSGMQQKTVQDALGRNVYSISNYNNFNETTEADTGDATDKSRDQVTKFIYNGAGQVKELIALDANGDGNQSDNQSTKYLYEDTVSASLRTNEIYPDSSDTSSSGSDQVKFQYNVAGDMTQSTDQRGTVIQYTFTNERRLELENVTTLGSGVDGHVRSKKRSYDSLARLEKYTSYANTGGTGTIRNELQYACDGLMNVTNIKQSHEGAATTPGTLGVTFSYDSTLSGGGSGDVYEYAYRRNKVTYPNGRAVFYDFDTANSGDIYSRMSKVRRMRETNVSGTILSEYNYTGGGRPAIVDMPQPKVKLDHFQGTSGTYAGWDRFGRTRQQFWTGYSGTANVDRIYYDYDYASNQLYSDIDSAIHSGNNRDQAYTYDSAHRLKTFDQGTLSGSTISGTPTQEQDWSLDGLGNWSNYVTKTSGTTALNQNRSVNKVNEIADITETTGPAWTTPGYDAAGSMTTIPQPGSPTASYAATYDAWHRLVKLANGGTTVAEYEYDATKQRIAKKVYASGVLDYEHHYYYNDNWQVLETFPETGENEELPVASYVWHPYYIDALLLRDYDEDADGIVVRYYYTQDVNFNVLSILSSTGTVLERYGYMPYGEAEVLTASFTADPDGLSDSANDITFTGQRYDSESRLMLYRHRYYHPVLGTFCSRDPVGYEGSQWNLYEYVGGRPTVATDPSGRFDVLGFDVLVPGSDPLMPGNQCRKRDPCEGGVEGWIRAKCALTCLTALKTPGEIQRIASDAESEGNKCANKAFQRTAANPHPIPNQAVRHCVASAYLRCNLGKPCARCLANQRELYQRTCTKQSCTLTQRGIANNNHGIDLERIRCGSECDDCVKAQNGGKLDNRPEIPDANNPDPECKKLPVPR
jgi:RHS repeat-associated protein